jgi:2-isopropylmalate synthase
MKRIAISDITLRLGNGGELSFKEKLELAREADGAGADIIELPQIIDEKTDALFVRTLAALVKGSVLSCPSGFTQESAETAWEALKEARKPRLHLIVPVSTVMMEYAFGMKPDKVLEMIAFQPAVCASLCGDVEFTAEDATRAEPEFLAAALERAIESGAKTVTLCDSAGVLLPDEFGRFIADLCSRAPALKKVCLSAECSDALGLGAACAVAAIQAGAGQVKASASSRGTPIKALASVFRTRGDSLGISCGLDMTGLNSSLSRIEALLASDKTRRTSFSGVLGSAASAGSITLDSGADIEAVSGAVKRLGYDLGPEDMGKVNEAVRRITASKTIGARELEAIIAGSAVQVPSTYRLKSYVINSGNVISATANVQLEKNGSVLSGLSTGDGPIDAAFLAIEQIIGYHYELDDFQIQSVTEGREAMGSALVKLRANGRLYSGEGLSTDIIGASILAYINALNKILYEEKG